LSSDRVFLPADIDPEKLPAHVAMIMDGNGRWAKKRIMSRLKGHEKGSETVRTIVRVCRELGIGYLTLYAFSTENWQRPKAEVVALMSLLRRFLLSERGELDEKNIRLTAIGEIDRLPANVRQVLEETVEMTRHNDAMRLTLALSYGGRSEIVRMVKAVATKVAEGGVQTDAITEDFVSEYLYTSGMPDPDLLIRTSGEMRISNFLLWQIAYAELYITDTLWPDFGREEFISILNKYQHRERRYGGV
jgi:undecaprenyl diphosphate synthase